jgi:hypothetical protein
MRPQGCAAETFIYSNFQLIMPGWIDLLAYWSILFIFCWLIDSSGYWVRHACAFGLPHGGSVEALYARNIKMASIMVSLQIKGWRWYYYFASLEYNISSGFLCIYYNSIQPKANGMKIMQTIAQLASIPSSSKKKLAASSTPQMNITTRLRHEMTLQKT